MDGLSRLSWIYGHVKSFVGHDRWVLAGVEQNRYSLHLDGCPDILGRQAVKIILGAVIGPKYAFMTNTIPLSANVDTCSLVSFFIF